MGKAVITMGRATMLKRSVNFLLISLLVLSCGTGSVFNQVDKITNQSWQEDKTKEYNVPILDTENGYDILFHLRNTHNYDYRNIWFFVETTAPGGQSLRDTIEFFLADEAGNWLGKGLGNYNTMMLVYKQNVRFPSTGIYTFKIQHAMREKELKNISDVGLQIRKTKYN